MPDQTTLDLSSDMLSALDTFIAERDDPPSRPEAIRIALRDWLIAGGYLSPDVGG